MSHTLSIDLVNQHGACKRDCEYLKTIFPGGDIVFDMSYLPQVLEKKINVLWATILLPRADQLALALAWYDRALAAVSPAWKAALRAIVATPATSEAEGQLTARLAERRDVDETDAVATTTAGVGYAAAAFAAKYAETPGNFLRNMAAVVVLAQWCAQAAALAESKTMDAVLDEFRSAVWQGLETHGAVLPPL